MKTRILTSLLILGALCVATLGASFPTQEAPDKNAQLVEGMKKWLATINPSSHHEKLGRFVGKWDTVFKIYMGGPGTPPIATTGSSEIDWVLGKRYIMEQYRGSTMMPDLKTGAVKEIPYEGIGFRGYNNHRNLYTTTWMSSQGTDSLSSRGSVDPSGKAFRSYGEMDEPMLNVIGRTVKYETRIIDKNKHTVKVYDLHAGDDYLVIDITYTRKTD